MQDCVEGLAREQASTVPHVFVRGGSRLALPHARHYGSARNLASRSWSVVRLSWLACGLTAKPVAAVGGIVRTRRVICGLLLGLRAVLGCSVLGVAGTDGRSGAAISLAPLSGVASLGSLCLGSLAGAGGSFASGVADVGAIGSGAAAVSVCVAPGGAVAATASAAGWVVAGRFATAAGSLGGEGAAASATGACAGGVSCAGGVATGASALSPGFPLALSCARSAYSATARTGVTGRSRRRTSSSARRA